MQEHGTQYLNYVNAHQAEIMSDLTKLVLAESPTYQKEKVLACGEIVKEIFRERLGVEPVQEYPQEIFGNHLYYEIGQGEKGLLLIGHYDTVWETDAPQWRQEGNELHGPGVFDMKAGIIIGVWALKAGFELGILPQQTIGFFLNTDEEMGSKTSRWEIQRIAKEYKAAIVLEPGGAHGEVTTARKGCTDYLVNFYGRSAHCGANHADGRNAIREMAHQIEYLESLTDYELGTTFNVGTCEGGSRPCMVPAFASFHVNCRYTTPEEAQRCYDIVHGLKPKFPDIRIEAVGEVGHLPMTEGGINAALYRAVQEAGAELDMTIGRQYSGGTSNANDVAGIGVPVIDGMGAAGRGAHAQDECIYLDQFLPRIALLMNTIRRL